MPQISFAVDYENPTESQREDIKFILLAIKEGESLRFMPFKFWGDKEVVLAAVNQNVSALEYASQDFTGSHPSRWDAHAAYTKP